MSAPSSSTSSSSSSSTSSSTLGLVGALVKAKATDSASSYDWHRKNAFTNIGADGISKRNKWIQEVRDIYQNEKVTWRQALTNASRNRANNTDYRTVKKRVIDKYTGRQAANVKCTGPVCPGKYDRQASKEYRPQGHKNKRVLSQQAAMNLLKKYYSERGSTTAKLIEAQKAMKTDISRKRNTALTPCPVKQVVSLNGVTRNIVTKTPECADNWLYRKIHKYDMKDVDNGSGKLYNEPLTKYRKSRY
jgi:hypothetical protein